jgi:hypothetical protein
MWQLDKTRNNYSERKIDISYVIVFQCPCRKILLHQYRVGAFYSIPYC